MNVPIKWQHAGTYPDLIHHDLSSLIAENRLCLTAALLRRSPRIQTPKMTRPGKNRQMFPVCLVSCNTLFYKEKGKCIKRTSRHKNMI